MLGCVLLGVALLTTWSPCAANKTTLHIGALLPIGRNPRFFNKDIEYTCAMALRDINESPDILPNHQLVMNLNDSQCDIGLTIYQLSDLLQSRKEKMVALIGEGCSTVTQPIAPATPLWNLALFNFLSTSPALSNTELYPNFYPVLPSENSLNPPRVAFMKRFGWTKAVILIESSEIFDLNAKNLRDSMEDAGIESPEFVLLPENRDYTTVIRQVKETGIRILFGLFYENVGREVICECLKEGISAPGYVWNFVGWYQSHDWYLDATDDKQNHTGGCTPEQLRSAVNGHITFDYAQVREDEDHTLVTQRNVREIAAELYSRKNLTLGLNSSEAFRQYSAYGYDAVLALGLSLHKIAVQLNATGEIDRLNNFTYDDDILLKKFREVTEDREFVFEGLTGPVRVATLLSPEEKLRQAAGRVVIYYNTKNASHFVALYDNNQTRLLLDIPWTTADGSVPSDSSPKRKSYSSIGIFIPVVMIASIGIIIDIILLVYNHQQKNHTMKKKNIPRINRWLILGTFGVFLAVIFYGFDGQFFQFQDPSSLHCCAARTIFLAFGFTLGFGSILVKTIAELYKLSGCRCVPHNSEDKFLRLLQYLLMGLLALLDAILLVMWMEIEPWRKEEQILDSDGKGNVVFVREKCSGGGSWADAFIIYKLFLLVVTLFLVGIRIKSITVKEKRHQPYKDMIVTCCGLGFASAGFGLLYIDDPGVEYGLVSFMFLILSYFILGSLFGMKCLGIVVAKKSLSSNEDMAMTEEKLRRQELLELRESNKRQKKLLQRVLQEGQLVGSLAEAVQNTLKPAEVLSLAGHIGDGDPQSPESA